MLRSMLVALVSLALAGPAMAQDKKAEAPAPKAAAKTTKKATKKAEAKKAPAKRAMKKAEAKKAPAKKAAKKAMAKKAMKKPVDLLAALGGFEPQPVRHPDVRGLHKFLRALAKAHGPEDMAANIAFPAYMVTTGKKGEAMAMSADKAAYLKTMQMPKGAEAAMKAMHPGKSQTVWISDGIAFVKTRWTLHSGRHWYHWDTGLLVVKGEHGWKVGAMVEPGWGASMGGKKTAAAAAPTATAQK